MQTAGLPLARRMHVQSPWSKGIDAAMVAITGLVAA